LRPGDLLKFRQQYRAKQNKLSTDKCGFWGKCGMLLLLCDRAFNKAADFAAV